MRSLSFEEVRLPKKMGVLRAVATLTSLACCVISNVVHPVAAQERPADVTYLVNEHCDFLILYQPDQTNSLSMVLRDEDRGINYRSNQVVLLAADSSRITLPAGTPFGNQGDPIWVLPQSQDPNLLYLGFSAERIPFGVFTGPFSVRLLAVDGPGHFFAWQAAEFGSLNVKMNSRDGITDEDKTTPFVGSHEHFNWGFTTNGVFRLTFQVDGRRTGESTNLVSHPATFTFHVLPLPTNAPPAELELTNAKRSPDGEFSFDIVGAANVPIEIQATTNLTEWITVTNMTPASSPQRFAIPIEAHQPHRWFRGAVMSAF